MLNHVEDGTLKSTSLCIVSSGMHRDTVAVHTFQQKITDYVEDVMPTTRKLYCFHDGAACQYKNYKNFSNLLNARVAAGASLQANTTGEHGETLGRKCLFNTYVHNVQLN